MCGGGDGGAAESRQMEIDRQDRIKKGIAAVNASFKGFDDSFYAGQRAKYESWAKPQVTKQYNQSLDDLRYGMARTGNQASSAAAKAKGNLLFDLNLANQQTSNNARDYEQKSRQAIEMARGDLVGQAVSTTDPTAAANSALSRATSLTSGPAYTPVGALFQAASPIVVNNMRMQQYQNGYNTPMQPSKGGSSGKVVT